MTTREFAEGLAGAHGADAAEVYRRLVLFLVGRNDGYGVRYGDGDRGKAREEADRRGYFWLPCVLCGEWRGGHEPHGNLMVGRRSGVSVCAGCEGEAARLNRLYPEGLEGA